MVSLLLFQGGSAGGGLGIFLLLPLVFIAATFYFQQRKTKRWQELLGSLKNGDRVTTSGGIRGLVIAMKDDAIFSCYLPTPKGPVFMSLLQKTFGKDQTTRTWDTIAKVAR